MMLTYRDLHAFTCRLSARQPLDDHSRHLWHPTLPADDDTRTFDLLTAVRRYPQLETLIDVVEVSHRAGKKLHTLPACAHYSTDDRHLVTLGQLRDTSDLCRRCAGHVSVDAAGFDTLNAAALTVAVNEAASDSHPVSFEQMCALVELRHAAELAPHVGAAAQTKLEDRIVAAFRRWDPTDVLSRARRDGARRWLAAALPPSSWLRPAPHADQHPSVCFDDWSWWFRRGGGTSAPPEATDHFAALVTETAAELERHTASVDIGEVSDLDLLAALLHIAGPGVSIVSVDLALAAAVADDEQLSYGPSLHRRFDGVPYILHRDLLPRGLRRRVAARLAATHHLPQPATASPAGSRRRHIVVVMGAWDTTQDTHLVAPARRGQGGPHLAESSLLSREAGGSSGRARGTSWTKAIADLPDLGTLVDRGLAAATVCGKDLWQATVTTTVPSGERRCATCFALPAPQPPPPPPAGSLRVAGS